MSALVIWMDSHEAKLFHLKTSGIETETVHAHGKSHHQETLGRNHTMEQTDSGKFYHTLAEKLKKVSEKEWLILGPGQGRRQFAHYLEENYKELASNVKGNEALDNKATENQILAEARKFFKHDHLFKSL